MINKTSLALVAALVAGSAVVAQADPMIDDSNTGLLTTIYNAPLSQLEAQGLPLNESAQTYLRKHQQISAARHPVHVRAHRSAATAGATYQQSAAIYQDDKQSGHL